MEQREVDNMLLSMIQKHFPSLPLSDEHTDWGKWLGFARAVYEAGRASPASVPGWKLVPDVPTSTMVLAGEKALSEHDFLRMDSAYCAMLATAPTPPVSEDRKDAERYRWLRSSPTGPSQIWELLSDDCQPPILTLKPPPPSKETLEAAGHRLALELECLLLDCKDNVVVSRWMDTACEALDAWRNLFPYNGPRLGD